MCLFVSSSIGQHHSELSKSFRWWNNAFQNRKFNAKRSRNYRKENEWWIRFCRDDLILAIFDSKTKVAQILKDQGVTGKGLKAAIEELRKEKEWLQHQRVKPIILNKYAKTSTNWCDQVNSIQSLAVTRKFVRVRKF